MGTNTGIGIGIGIPFRNNALGGDNIYFPPELKARMIGVWDNYGKKNTDADRNIIKNKIPNAGGDLEILNAAYKLNSGFGEYKFDFERWALTKPPTICKKYNDSFNITYVGRPVSEGECIVETGNNSDSDIQVYFKVEISGIEDDMEGWFNTANFRNRQQLYNGINIINVTVNSKHWYGFDFIRTDGTVLGNCNIVVKQIPAFEGALVTDGINDIIASIKTLEEWNVGDKGITIISMIHQISTSKSITTTNNLRNEGRVVGRNIVNNTDKTGIYGWYKEDLQGTTATLISNILGDKNDYTGHYTENTNPITNSKFYVQGYAIENGFTELSSVAHYWTFAVLGKATADEINLIIAKYNLDRTLRPDILCNIAKQGITNDNHADFNDKLIDYSGNGRDIQMYNLAWKGDSGVAAKKFETIKDYLIVPDEGLQELTIYNEFSYKVKSIKYADRYWAIQTLNKTDVSYPITIVSDKNIIWRNAINYTDENGVKRSIRKETNVPANTPTQVFVLGFNDFDVPDNYTKVNCVAYATRTDITEFTITFIPSCKGGILLDGIEDFGKVTGMPIYKDYTFIADRHIITNDDSGGIVASKSESLANVAKQGAFIFEYLSMNIISTWSYYKNNSLVANSDSNRNISYQSKYSYNGKALEIGEGKDSDKLWIGTIRDNDKRFANIAIYSLMSFPYSMSEFLIERQLKKHKLGTLYPDMVEFRPIIKQDDRIKSIKYYIDGKTANIGQYYPIGTGLGIAVETVQPYMVKSLKVNGVNTIPNVDYKGFNARLDSKSPQKITMDIVVDTSIILFNPTINSNAVLEVGNEETMPELFTQLNNGEIDGIILYMQGDKAVLPNNWIDKNTKVRAIIYCLDTVSEEDIHFTVDGKTKYCYSAIEDGLAAFGIMDEDSQEEQYMTNVLTANTIDIQLDQYIRYEDIVQPYPVLLRFNDENGNEVSWGGKFRVGSTITRIGSAADSNLLPNIYNIFGLLLNDNQVTSSKVIVEKTMVFKAKSAYIFDNNEPNCILSPRLLRIPNSSYKILGHIPDISGHGNHGVIHNSAYAEGSGVNEDGSYQFDGVDDFVTIPTLSSGGKQVLMKVNWDKTIADAILYDQRGYPNEFAIYNADVDNNNNPVFAYQARNNGQTYIDGILNKNIKASELRAITHNITITNELSTGTNTSSPVIGSNRVRDAYFTKMALYDFMLFDKISTDDKIKELNEYVGIEAKVELPPYYWDAYGKTNLDADKATIQQRGVAEGDYDITNYNHAYDKMSGYGGYAFAKFDNTSEWSARNREDGIEVIERNAYSFTAKRIGAGTYFWDFNNHSIKTLNRPLTLKAVSNNNTYVRWEFKYRTAEKPDVDSTIILVQKEMTPNVPITVTLPYKTEQEITDLGVTEGSAYYLFYFDPTNIPIGEEYTIEMLPLYPNGLVYDGVTDYSENANIPAFTDYTYIFKRELLNLDKVGGGASLYKGSFYSNGGRAFIVDINDKNPNSEMSGYSYGNRASTSTLKTNKIIYGTKTSVNGVSVTPGSNTDNASLTLGKWDVTYKQMVFYKLILYPKNYSTIAD